MSEKANNNWKVFYRPRPRSRDEYSVTVIALSERTARTIGMSKIRRTAHYGAFITRIEKEV